MRAMILATFTGLALAIAGPAFAQSRAPSAAAEAPADVPETPFLTGVVWLEQPDAQTFARLYPQQAIDVRAEGRVILDCLVEAGGRLACTIESEDPPGYGFGEATLRLSQVFRVAPQTRDGVDTSGGRVRRAIRWLLAN